MGNAPSSEAQRRAPHKLSKPRTTNPTTAGLFSPHDFANSPSRFSTSVYGGSVSYPASPALTQSTAPSLGASAVSSGTGSAVSKSEEPVSRRASVLSVQGQKENNRRSLFRSRSSQRTDAQVRERPARRNSSIGFSTPGPSSLPVRTNSMTFETAIGAHYAGQISEKCVFSPVIAACFIANTLIIIVAWLRDLEPRGITIWSRMRPRDC